MPNFPWILEHIRDRLYKSFDKKVEINKICIAYKDHESLNIDELKLESVDKDTVYILNDDQHTIKAIIEQGAQVKVPDKFPRDWSVSYITVETCSLEYHPINLSHNHGEFFLRIQSYSLIYSKEIKLTSKLSVCTDDFVNTLCQQYYRMCQTTRNKDLVNCMKCSPDFSSLLIKTFEQPTLIPAVEPSEDVLKEKNQNVNKSLPKEKTFAIPSSSSFNGEIEKSKKTNSILQLPSKTNSPIYPFSSNQSSKQKRNKNIGLGPLNSTQTSELTKIYPQRIHRQPERFCYK